MNHLAGVGGCWLMVSSKLSIQKLLDAMLLDSILLTNPQPVLTKVVNINLANPLRLTAPET